MEKIFKLLEKNDVQISEELKKEINEVIKNNQPDNNDLFTQSELDEIVKKRLGREQKLHEQEITELKSKMKDLVDPKKVKEYEEKINELENKSVEKEKELKIDYELQLAAKDAGVDDLDYFEFLVEKNDYKKRLKVDGEGRVYAADSEGNILTEDGVKLGPSALVSEMKEKNPKVFSDNKGDDANIGGGGNPKGGSTKDKIKNTKSLALELGYKKKDKE